MEVWTPSDEHIVRKSIPQFKPTHQQQIQYDRSPLQALPRTLPISPERTNQQQRRQPPPPPPSQPSSFDQTMRPIIPEPTFQVYHPATQQVTIYERRQTNAVDYEEYPRSSAFRSVSPSSNAIDQQQGLYGPRRPLPPST